MKISIAVIGLAAIAMICGIQCTVDVGEIQAAVERTFEAAFKAADPSVDMEAPVGKNFDKFYKSMLKEINLPDEDRNDIDKLIAMLKLKLEKSTPANITYALSKVIAVTLELPGANEIVKKAILNH